MGRILRAEAGLWVSNRGGKVTGVAVPGLLPLAQRSRLPLFAAWSLLVVSAAIVVAVYGSELVARASRPEALVRGYFAALEAGDAATAAQSIAPSSRARWAEFIANGVSNQYRILGVAVRQTSLLDRLRGDSGGPREITVFVEVTEVVSGAQWQAGPRVPLVEEGGALYLGRPPLS